jgi:N6-L-threonylcarbamoyladenine synthase
MFDIISQMIVLGIETSCDETAVGIVELTDLKVGAILIANSVASSLETHVAYGGVVPELAARAHYESMNFVLEDALRIFMKKLGLADLAEAWTKIDAIAVTYGAGLGGCLQIGIMAAKTLAEIYNKPMYGCNHVEGHVYANFITSCLSDDSSSSRPYVVPNSVPQYPLLALIVSGNHTQLVHFKGHFDYNLIGRTYDDAIGESFDKVARMLGLPYPGGPQIARIAHDGDEKYFKLPISKIASFAPGLLKLRGELKASTSVVIADSIRNPDKQNSSAAKASPLYSGLELTGRDPSRSKAGLDFSFSGLKTAVLRALQVECGLGIDFPSSGLPERLSEPQKCNMAASFQRVAVETVVQKTLLAYQEFGAKSVVIAGGVAANTKLRERLAEVLDISINYTDIRLCTDNGAMIATLGAYKALLNTPPSNPTTLEANPSLVM